MAAPYNDSFDGTAFSILYRGQQEDNDSLTNIRKMPRGGTTYVDIGGALPGIRTYVIQLPDLTTYEALRSKVPKQGTFVDTLRGTQNAVLRKLSWEANAADGTITAHAVLVLT